MLQQYQSENLENEGIEDIIWPLLAREYKKYKKSLTNLSLWEKNNIKHNILAVVRKC